MKRKLILIGIGLGAFCVGLIVSRVLSLRFAFQPSVAIPAIQLHPKNSCLEAETSPELSRFFAEFRDALTKEDIHKLFTMTRRCNFDWYADAALSHPLLYEEVLVPSQLETPFEPWGQRLVFESEKDFALNTRVCNYWCPLFRACLTRIERVVDQFLRQSQRPLVRRDAYGR